MWGKRNGRVGAFLDDASEIEGKYHCAGTVMLDARLRGEIMAKDTLIIGEHAIVEAAVEATVLVVHGTIVGNVTVSERVELKRNARITGDVEAPIISMEPGAVIDGCLRMTKAKGADLPHSAVVVPLKA
jgi:cytoskeletal protein CcmA (bactofilin family)